MRNSTHLTDQGIEALIDGDRARARELLQAALQEDPNNEQGWWALSFAVDKPEHALKCVQKILTLNPQHEKAHERLADLQVAVAASAAPQAQPPAQPLASQAPPESAQWTVESKALQATGEYFYFEPKAERFVRGETDRLPINGCMLLILIPFVLSGLLILSLSVVQWVRIRHFSRSKWAYTEGTYVSKDEVAESAGRTRYYVTYRFVVDDRVYVVEESVEQGIHDRATEGAALRVYYRLGDPNIASIRSVSRRGGQPLGLICGTLLWWALILGLAYYILSPARKRQRLAQEGALISGEIIRCSGRKDSDNDFRLKAEVRFRSPQTGQWINKNYLLTRNDLKGKPLPQPGTPVHILYINDKTFEAL